jgi:MFS family permease
VMAVGAVALLASFVAQERRAPEPILPPRLFRQPVFVIVSAALFLTTLAFFAVIVYMPVYLQVATGATATESGLLLLPLLLAGTGSTAVAGRVISRTGRYKAFPVAGLALMALGLVLLSGIDADTAYGEVAALLVLFGVGFGMVSQVLTIAIQNAVERRELGIATASANLFRSLGGSVGVAVFGALFAAHVHGPDPAAVASALHLVFLAAAPVAALGALVVLTLKEVPLRHA